MEIVIESRPSASVLSDAAFYENLFPVVARWISKHNGSFETARDLFHDALIIYSEKEQRTDFAPDSAAEAYLMGIVKHLWFQSFAKEKDLKPLSASEVGIP